MLRHRTIKRFLKYRKYWRNYWASKIQKALAISGRRVRRARDAARAAPRRDFRLARYCGVLRSLRPTSGTRISGVRTYGRNRRNSWNLRRRSNRYRLERNEQPRKCLRKRRGPVRLRGKASPGKAK